MRRVWVVATLALALLAASLAAEAQTAGKRVPRIGYLDGGSLSALSVRIEALRQGLRELGYVEGETSSSSGGLQRARRTGYPVSPPSWCV